MIEMARKGSGWHNESRRHSLARRGVRTVNGRMVRARASGIELDAIEESRIIHNFSELIEDELDRYIEVNRDLASYINDHYDIFIEDEDGNVERATVGVARYGEVMGLTVPYYQNFLFAKDYEIRSIVDRYDVISGFVEDFMGEHGYYNREVHDAIWHDMNPELKDKIVRELIDGFENYYYKEIIIPTAKDYLEELEGHGVIIGRKGGR